MGGVGHSDHVYPSVANDKHCLLMKALGPPLAGFYILPGFLASTYYWASQITTPLMNLNKLPGSPLSDAHEWWLPEWSWMIHQHTSDINKNQSHSEQQEHLSWASTYYWASHSLTLMSDDFQNGGR
ncbi:hypothetical protein EDC04DRAFT_2609480 [Pisolithus marmoratus]|nr:hypothetical protein EDC04DRAFT_2609480 [Pisolithus marmoratus]